MMSTASAPRPPRSACGTVAPAAGAAPGLWGVPRPPPTVLPEDLPSADPTPAPPPRTPARLRALLSERAEEPESVDADEPEPLDPPEPVVSAKATGIAAAADPTPRAIASAPTRPMERAYTVVADADSVAAEDDRPHSIARTRAGAEVRG